MLKRIRPYLLWVLLIFLWAGLIYPVIGLVAIICMIAPIAVAPFRGRFWCGNYCPRGSFYDYVLARISPHKKIPTFFSHPVFRGSMVFFIFAVFAVQMHYAWGDLAGMGLVFVRIILVTTLIGIVLGIIYHQRTWCSFCPMGTMASWISKKKKAWSLQVDKSCVNCKLCTKVCPMQLSPYSAKVVEEGFTHSDCLKCDRCMERCPKGAIKISR